jgi:hypothetical protein
MSVILKYKFIFGLSLASLLFTLGGFVWALIALRGAGSSIVLHFNDIAGITSIGGFGLVEFMGIFGILVVFVNGAIAFEFDRRDPFLGKLIAALTLLLSILLFIGFASIMRVN